MPFELLPLISSHLVPAASSFPTVYHIPPALHLDRLACGAPLPPKAPVGDLPPPPPAARRQMIQLASVTVTTTATASPIPAKNYPPVPYPPAKTATRSSTPLPSVTESATTTAPVTVVSPHQPTVLKFDAAELTSTLDEVLDSNAQPSTPVCVLEPRGATGTPVAPAPMTAPLPSLATSRTPSPPPALPFLLGNLLLSSCPGKKGERVFRGSFLCVS